MRDAFGVLRFLGLLGLSLERFDLLCFSCGFERIEKELEPVALHDSVEFVDRERDSVVGDAVLRKVVGTDSFGAVSASYLCFSCCSEFGVLCFADMSVDSGGENFECFLAVAVLRFFVLALDNLSGGDMGDTDGGIGRIDMLSSRTLCAEGFCSEVLFQEGLLCFRRLREDGDGRGGGMDPALCLGFGNALDAVDA